MTDKIYSELGEFIKTLPQNALYVNLNEIYKDDEESCKLAKLTLNLIDTRYQNMSKNSKLVELQEKFLEIFYKKYDDNGKLHHLISWYKEETSDIIRENIHELIISYCYELDSN